MLRKVLQRSLTRPLVQPIVKRAFSIQVAKRQESDTLKPTSGINIFFF